MPESIAFIKTAERLRVEANRFFWQSFRIISSFAFLLAGFSFGIMYVITN